MTAGGVVSFTVTVKLHMVDPSVQVTVVVPTGKNAPEATGVPLAVHVAVPPQVVETVNGTFAPHCVLPAPVPTTILLGQTTVHATELRVKQKRPQSFPGRWAFTTMTNAWPAGTSTEKVIGTPEPIWFPESPK